MEKALEKALGMFLKPCDFWNVLLPFHASRIPPVEGHHLTLALAWHFLRSAVHYLLSNAPQRICGPRALPTFVHSVWFFEGQWLLLANEFSPVSPMKHNFHSQSLRNSDRTASWDSHHVPTPRGLRPRPSCQAPVGSQNFGGSGGIHQRNPGNPVTGEPIVATNSSVERWRPDRTGTDPRLVRRVKVGKQLPILLQLRVNVEVWDRAGPAAPENQYVHFSPNEPKHRSPSHSGATGVDISDAPGLNDRLLNSLGQKIHPKDVIRAPGVCCQHIKSATNLWRANSTNFANAPPNALRGLASLDEPIEQLWRNAPSNRAYQELQTCSVGRNFEPKPRKAKKPLLLPLHATTGPSQ